MTEKKARGAQAGDGAERPALPATSWAVLGLLSFGEELSGYDLKKWSDWSLRFFYWSPSFSQIYGELKRLEKVGYVSSRMVAQETGNRDKRVYVITDEGMAAVRHWAREAPVEPPVLKHGVMLRLWLGHLLEADQMREVLGRHREYAETMRQRAEVDAAGARAEAAWAYPSLVLKWSERYYASERDLADAMLADLDEMAAAEGAGEAGDAGRRRP
ncbi:PadR family transcriptional regulator [Streptomyces sp. NRRL F-4489]|uniref:PadR family transcriptional regulator n=1 Tax=Streptomyces sp. NRRL F-4489 TaxID=1609095 RepID=UPI000747AF82|nr:PadR family transcriptional regulator [Streptomyces sp. NRRL F-4489]KUL35011.1 PadR family transcriptional regulator [Streptomyces sp. NRRL F-4489]